MLTWKKRIAGGVMLLLLTACGAPDDHAANTSNVHFITFGPSVSGLVSQVKKPALSACLSGHNSSNREKWAKDVQEVILKWIQPLRSATIAELASQVQVIDGRGRCDVDVIISPNVNPAFTSISNRPVVNMNTSGHFGSYNVLLHEFGHAFALSDTYQGRQSGNCKPGQPQAVMCNVSFSDLQGDDKSGVLAVFKRVFPSDQPRPNNGGSTVDPAQLSVKLAAALGKESAQDTYEFAVGVSGTDAKAGMTVSYCVGACGAGSFWKSMTYKRTASGTYIFSADGLEISDGAEVKIQAVSESRKKISVVAFKAI